MIGIQQTEVVVVIIKIQDTSDIKASYFMVCYSSSQNIQIFVSTKKYR